MVKIALVLVSLSLWAGAKPTAPSLANVRPNTTEGRRTLCVLYDVTLPRLLDPTWSVEVAGSGPPPNMVTFDCAAPPACGGAIRAGEVVDVPELAVVWPAHESPDKTPMHSLLWVHFIATEGGRAYFWNTLRNEDLHFDVLTVEARLK